jgi:hypothetical protein
MSTVSDMLKAADPRWRIEVGRSEHYYPRWEHWL